VDRQDGVPGVVLFCEEGPDLRLGQVLFKAVEGRAEIGVDVFAFFVEFPQDFELFLVLEEFGEKGEVLVEDFLSPLEGLEGFLIVPNLRGGEPAVDGQLFGSLVIEVKENLGFRRTCRGRFRGGNSGQTIFRTRTSLAEPFRVFNEARIRKSAAVVKPTQGRTSPVRAWRESVRTGTTVSVRTARVPISD
jgi:hypothetical protein